MHYHDNYEQYTPSTCVDQCVEHKIYMFLYHTCHLCTTEQTILDDGTPCEKEKIQLILNQNEVFYSPAVEDLY